MINYRRFSIRQLYCNHVKSWLHMCQMLQAEIKFTQLTQLCNFFCCHRQRRMRSTSAFAGFNFTKYKKFFVFRNYVKFTQPGTVVSLNKTITQLL